MDPCLLYHHIVLAVNRNLRPIYDRTGVFRLVAENASLCYNQPSAMQAERLLNTERNKNGMNIFSKLFDPTAGELKRLGKLVDQIDSFEDAHKKLTDAQLRAKTAEFRERLSKGETLDSLLPEAFSVVREATDRVMGKRQFRVQMMGGIVLHEGRIAEMKTGEGKTLTATMPAYLNALSGKGVHVVTVNDYLARFQGEDIGRIFRFLDMSVGVIVHDLDQDQRRAAYACDVTYGTNNEMGFDYLRDNMVIYERNRVQRGHHFAIVDEVDSILIDEARTPLIISGAGEKSTDLYEKADRFVCTLQEGVEPEEDRWAENPLSEEEKAAMRKDFVKDEKKKTCNLSEAGARKAERWFGVENLSDIQNSELLHHINAALKAHAMMKRDVDYVVQNNEVIIVDEFTGRLMIGRRYSDGLHQAIEAKEHVGVQRESKTLATITFQNYFRMYGKLSGMTGTAKTEEEEFKGIYSLDVVQIPTNMPMIRKDLNDQVYRTVNGKFKKVVEEIENRHKTGQPILVGTVSVEVSEHLSKLLTLRGIQHEVLNAKQHAREADIVAQAGHYGAVTIATNMAGRGTDILLGGNPEYLARRAMRQKGYDDAAIDEATGFNEDVSEEILSARALYKELYTGFKKQTDEEHDRVVEVGGLHILGTERHESRRIDNQLRGRAGRQGDPGSSQFFLSMQDDLMRLFGSDRVSGLIEKMGLAEDEAIEAKMLTGQIENAQKRIEARNYEIRKNVLQYDDVMNEQRKEIYGQRLQVLEGRDMHETIVKMADALIDEAVLSYCGNGDVYMDWDIPGLSEYLEKLCARVGFFAAQDERLKTVSKEELTALLKQEARDFYALREAELGKSGIDVRELERVVLLSCVDRRWMDHIDAMDQLRDGIGLRAYGNKNPITEYQIEGYDMFDEMVRLIREDTVRRMYHVRVQQERREAARPQETNLNQAKNAGGPQGPRRVTKKVGRNDPCPCGSGKKYKNCHGKEA